MQFNFGRALSELAGYVAHEKAVKAGTLVWQIHRCHERAVRNMQAESGPFPLRAADSLFGVPIEWRSSAGEAPEPQLVLRVKAAPIATPEENHRRLNLLEFTVECLISEHGLDRQRANDLVKRHTNVMANAIMMGANPYSASLALLLCESREGENATPADTKKTAKGRHPTGGESPAAG